MKLIELSFYDPDNEDDDEIDSNLGYFEDEY